MSGEDERSRRAATPGPTPRPAAGANPFLDEAPGTPAAAPTKARRGKPPPGIISAGGVDMARAHASNIRPMAESEQKPIEQAKVVLSAEKTDPRRMRTMRRIDMPGDSAHPPPVVTGAAGESPWAKPAAEVLDRSALPSANIARAPAPAPVPEKKQEKSGGAIWIRVATVAVILLLIAGVSKRLYVSTKHNAGTPTTPYAGGPLIPEPLPNDTAAETADPAGTPRPTAVGARGPGPGTGDTAAVDPSAEPSVEGSASAEPTAPPIRVKPPPPPPPPKATFTPLFQLPDEKKNWRIPEPAL